MKHSLLYNFGRGVGGLTLAVALSVLMVLATIVLEEHGVAPGKPAECAVVFGSAVYGFNTPGPAMLRRVSTAVRLYHEGAVQKLIFTGGKTNSTDQSEADVMRVYAKRQSIPDSAIVVESQAQSTWENLKYTKPLTDDCDGVVAISDGYHLGRIRLTAWMLGWGSLPTVPADQSPPLPQHVRSVLREFAAIMYYVFMPTFNHEPEVDEEPLRSGIVLT